MFITNGTRTPRAGSTRSRHAAAAAALAALAVVLAGCSGGGTDDDATDGDGRHHRRGVRRGHHGLDPEVVAAKALAAHSILLSFLGVPAIYFHSLFGSTSDHEGMRVSGIARRINRGLLDADRLVEELRTHPRRRPVFEGLRAMLLRRRELPAFSPYGTQAVEVPDPRVLAVRRAAGTPDEIVCVSNVTAEAVTLPGLVGVDVLTGRRCEPLVLGPYGYAWLRPGA